MKPILTLTAALVLGAPAFAQTAAERLSIPEPAAREGATTAVDGAEIFHSQSGTGPALVLLHGYPLSGALFARVRDRLDDTHTVVTIDHRGYGKSTTPEPVTDVATYATDALAVLDDLGIDSAAIGGMSMGGPILFEMYRQDPDRFNSAILIDTNAGPAGAIEAGIWSGAEAALADGGSIDAIVPFLMPNMLTGATRFDVEPAAVDYLTQAMEETSLDGALGGAAVLGNRPDSTETLAGMDIPVLVIVGQEDPVYPVEIAQGMADAAPQGTLVVVPGASHAAVFEKPEEVAAAIEDFLQSN